jgi:hypothetical protein
MLENSGPKTDPWRTPDSVTNGDASSQKNVHKIDSWLRKHETNSVIREIIRNY